MVLHFAMRGSLAGGSSIKVLDSNGDHVAEDQVAQWIADCCKTPTSGKGSVECVVLIASYTEEIAEVLHKRHRVSCVIARESVIDDDAAVTFLPITFITTGTKCCQ